MLLTWNLIILSFFAFFGTQYIVQLFDILKQLCMNPFT